MSKICLRHLPPDDDGWNDATRANYEREYGDGPPCTCDYKDPRRDQEQHVSIHQPPVEILDEK